MPVAMIDIMQTNVSPVNGPIRRGDLLTTTRIPGHLTRYSSTIRYVEAVVGKFVEPLGDGWAPSWSSCGSSDR